MELDLEDKLAAGRAADRIMELAQQEGPDGIAWLRENTFLDYGKYETEARKIISTMTNDVIDAIDENIARKLAKL